MATPSSQKADQRPISFVLDDGKGSPVHVPLVLRPEDVTRPETPLMMPTPTFGGAWIDDFGPGIATIQISGHTGWRGGQSEDGVASFAKLRDNVWVQFHARRAQAVQEGKSPDTVKLIYVDGLDDMTYVVYPGQFILKRNRARPLLMMYQISMIVLTDWIVVEQQDPISLVPSKSLSSSDKVFAGIDSLTASITKLQNGAANLRHLISANIVAPVERFVSMSTGVMNKVRGVVSAANGIIDDEAAQIIGVARDVAQVGRNAFLTFNAIADLPANIEHDIGAIANAYENAFCVLSNAFLQVRSYPDYTGLYGSSNCSSTVGGSPLSPLRDVNSLDVITPALPPPPSVTQSAKSVLDSVRMSDPVLRPLPPTDMADRLGVIADGVILT